MMMQTVAESGAGLSGASALHMNIFGLNPVVVFGSEEQKKRMLPPLIAGEDKACFAVTEPDAGLDTLKLKTKAVRDGDRYLLSGQKIWISTAQVASKMLILARTTPLEKVKRTHRGPEPVLHRPRPPLTSMCAKSQRWAAAPSTPTSCSSTRCRCRWPTASARRAGASNTSCTA